jgi:S1-C subfamily serine protease
MIRSLIVSAALLLGIAVSPASAEWPLDRMNAQIDATNIVLGEGADPFCSGTIIDADDRLILTASHCVQHAVMTRPVTKIDPVTGEVSLKVVSKQGNVEIWQNRYDEYEFVGSVKLVTKIVRYDVDSDFAVLQVLDKTWKPVMVAPIAPKTHKLTRGQTIYIVGNPAGFLDNSVTKGIISATHRKLNSSGDGTKYFQVDAAAIGGNSGGAIYDDQGELIGILSAGMTRGAANFGVPFEVVRDWLAASGYTKFGGNASNVTPTPVSNNKGPY